GPGSIVVKECDHVGYLPSRSSRHRAVNRLGRTAKIGLDSSLPKEGAMRAKPLPRHARILHLEMIEERCLLSYSITDLARLGGTSSLARGLNAVGQVIVQAQTSIGTAHGFLYTDGALTDLGTLGGTNSDAHAINDLGEVVGAADLANGTSHAFLYGDEGMTDL